MDHSIIGIVLIVGIAAYGILKLAQVFIMWHGLGFAIQHHVIDAKGLVKWAEGFGKKVVFVNLAVFACLILGIAGAVVGEQMLSMALGKVFVMASAVGLMVVCRIVYGKLYDEFHSVVGLSVDAAADEISGAVSV